MNESRHTLPGSQRRDYAAQRIVGPVEAATPVEITLVLRRRAEPPASAFAAGALTREQLAQQYGADPADIDAVVAHLTDAGVEVLSTDPASRRVRVRGSADLLSGLFGTTLQQARSAPAADAPMVRVRSGELTVDESLAGRVVGVLGLDDRPQAAERYRIAASRAVSVSYTPLDLARVYRMPDGDGAGQRIAIIELGGGFGQRDLDVYFSGLGLATPTVRAVGVDGASNAPGQDPSGADGEVLLDIEVAGAIAPAAEITVYFAPNSDAGFLDAISEAAHATPAPTSISISWGQSEDQWSGQARDAMDAAMADAALLGVTVTAAAGDSGSTDNQPQGAPHVDFPASSPHALACGGTTLQASADGSVTSETVWNNGGQGGSTGGGVSAAFPVPDWQSSAGVPARSGGSGQVGRGVPDVAGDADPQTGYRVLVDGQSSVIGGTSAVSPLWAGLVCRLAQVLGRPLGLLQPALYASAQPGVAPPGFRDIVSGTNGAYSAGPGWDPCTGLGVPDGLALLDALRAAAP